MNSRLAIYIPSTAHPHDGFEPDLPGEVPREHPVELLGVVRPARAEQRDVVHRARTELTHATCTEDTGFIKH